MAKTNKMIEVTLNKKDLKDLKEFFNNKMANIPKEEHMLLYYDKMRFLDIANNPLSDEELETYKKAMKKFSFCPSGFERFLNQIQIGADLDECKTDISCFVVKDAAKNMGLLLNKKQAKEYKGKFYAKFRKEFEYGSPILSKSSLSDEEFFYNVIKLMLLFCTRGITITNDDGETYISENHQNIFVSMFGVYNAGENTDWDIVNKIIIDNYAIDERYNNLDELVEDYLMYLLCTDMYYRGIEKEIDIKNPFESMNTSYFLLLFNSMISEIGTYICTRSKIKASEDIINEYNDKKTEYDTKIEGLKKINEVLEQKLNKAMRNLRMYIESYEKQGFSNSDTLKSICNNEDTKKEEKYEISEEDKCTIQKLSAALTEAERENNKLREKLEKAVEDNNNLYEEIKSIMPEDTDEEIIKPEVQIKEVDKNLKYAFVLKNKGTLDVEKELMERFPNSMFIKDQNVLNKSIDLVVLLTKFLSHSLYHGTKKVCKDNNIPYIHCANINIDKIEDAIWNYYNAS